MNAPLMGATVTMAPLKSLGMTGSSGLDTGDLGHRLESELIQALGAQQAVVFGDGDPNSSALMVIQDDRSPEHLCLAQAAVNADIHINLIYINPIHEPARRFPNGIF